MAEEKLGVAQVPIRATLDELDKDLEDSRKKIHGSLGETFKSLGGTVAKIGGAAVLGGLAAVVGAVSAIGGAAFASAMQLDEAFDTMAIGTGATGDALEGLKDDFKEVFKDFRGEASTVADVMSGLNSKLGITGETLQDLGKPLAEVTRLLGGDAATNTQLFSRVMGDWSINVEDGGKTLDKLFTATQMSGVGMDALMGKVVAFGSPMRLMGFTLDDSIALFAKWEKEGVNSELVMGSLRIAAGKFAAEGLPLRESLLATFDSIQKNTDASAALAQGMEVFGARAGPDMVAAIREGRFAVDDLVAGLANSEGAILRTAAATADWPETWQQIKNTATVALEPLGTALMGVANTALQFAGPALTGLAQTATTTLVPVLQIGVEAVSAFFQGLQNGGTVLGALGSAIGVVFGEEAMGQANLVIAQATAAWTGMVQTMTPFVGWLGENATPVLTALGAMLVAAVIPAFWGWATAAAGVVAANLPLILIIAAIGLAVGLLVAAWQGNWLGIRDAVTSVLDFLLPYLEQAWATMQQVATVTWAAIQTAVQVALAWMQANVVPVVQAIVAWLVENWPQIQAVVETVMQAVWTVIQTVWGLIGETIQNALTVIQGVIQVVTSAIKGDWEGVWNGVNQIFEGYWNQIEATLRAAVEILDTVTGGWLTGTARAIEGAWNGVVSYLTETWGDIKRTATTTWDGIVGAIGNTVSGLWRKVFTEPISQAKGELENAWNSMRGTATTILQDTVNKLKYEILGGFFWKIFAEPLGTALYEIGNFTASVRQRFTDMLSGIHISTPHINVSWQDLPVLGHIPSGVSVEWYGRGGEFIANGPMLIGVGELGPERVSIEPVGHGETRSGNGRGLTLNYYDQRPSGAAPDLVNAARQLEWQASMRGI